MVPTYFCGYLTVFTYVIISIQVRLEEEFLSKIHGKEYSNYQSKAGRFFPKFKADPLSAKNKSK